MVLIPSNSFMEVSINNDFNKSFPITPAKNREAGMEVLVEQTSFNIIFYLMPLIINRLEKYGILKGNNRSSHHEFDLENICADVEMQLKSFWHTNHFAKVLDIQELQARIDNLIENQKKTGNLITQPLEVRPSEISTDSVEGRFLKQSVKIIETHINDSTFGVAILAVELAVSQTQLYRKLRAIAHSRPNEFIRNIRLSRASDLMKCNAGNVSEIAYQCGFNNLSYFAKVFKEKFGVTPGEFLKSIKYSSLAKQPD